jgi:hypothetical protein
MENVSPENDVPTNKPFNEWVKEEGGKYYYFELDGKGYYACPSAAKELCGGEIKLKEKI